MTAPSRSPKPPRLSSTLPTEKVTANSRGSAAEGLATVAAKIAKWLESEGYRVVRARTYELDDTLDGGLEHIVRHLAGIDVLAGIRSMTSHPRALCIGRTMPVLFDKAGRKAGRIIGRSPYLQSVRAEAAASMLGSFMPVDISAAEPHSLSGVVAG